MAVPSFLSPGSKHSIAVLAAWILGSIFLATSAALQAGPAQTSPAVVAVVPAAGTEVATLTQVTVTFSEAVVGLEAGDLEINHQPATGFAASADRTTFTFSFTQPLPGLIVVTWNESHGITSASGGAFDPAALSATWSYTLKDSEPPRISELAPVPQAHVGRLTQLEILFAEAVSGVDAADLLINDQPAVAVAGAEAGPYVFKFAQPPPGVVEFRWASNHGISDLATPKNQLAGGVWTVVLDVPGTMADVVINEFVAANLTGLRDETGETQDWIEIWNRGVAAVDLLGWSLTDDRDAPGKWVFPSRVLNPGEYLVVFASGKNLRDGEALHANFKLNAFGDYLALFNPEFPRTVVTEFSPEFPEQRNDYAYGQDSNKIWRYFSTPTPGGPNGSSGIAGLAPAPHFSVPRGIFDAPFRLLLTSPLEGATIRYTTNGSEPTATTGFLYSEPLWVSNTTTLRAAVFKPGYLPSRIRTHSYVFLDQVLEQPNRPSGFPSNWGRNTSFPGGLVPADYEMDLDPVRVDPNNPASPVDPSKLRRLKDGLRELPIVSIVMKTDDMFGPSGLYPNSRESATKTPNEKPCSVEMVLPDGTTAFATTCSIDLHGNASRNPIKNPKHGFKLAFKGAFGEASLKHRLFPDSPAQEFDDIILRPDFNSSWRHWSDTASNGNGAFQRTRATRTRDAWIKHTFRDMGQVASHNRFFHLFINGLYWGTFDFTEQPTDTFASNYFGGEREDFDVFDQGALTSGTPTAYNAMLAISNLSSPANYELMKRYLDIPQFIDYMLLHFFVGHQDWGLNKNWYAVRKRVTGPEGTFKYFPWDGECHLLSETVNRVPSAGGSTDVPSGLHTRLDDNPEYRLAFADRVFKHLIAPGGALTVGANIDRWRHWQAVLDKPIVAESARWGDYRRDVHRYSEGAFVLYTRENHWSPENQRLVTSYFPNRPAIVLNQLRTAGLYPRVEAPLFNQHGGRVARGFGLTLAAPAGTIYYTVDGSDPRLYGSGAVAPSAIAHTGAPISVNASMVLKARVLSGTTWSALNEALFSVAELGVPLRITEVMYHPPGGDAYEFIEVMNTGSTPLDLSGYSFQGVNYIFPANTVLRGGATLLLGSSADPSAFRARYPTAIAAGWFGGTLDNGGERLSILDREGRTVTALHYDDENGWPAGADGGGFSLEIIDAIADPNAAANWRASFAAQGTPGLPPAKPPAPAIAFHEVMADNVSAVANGSGFPDWIELHNRTQAEVSLAGWSLSDDGNPRQFVFPTGTTIPAGGYLVVWCDANSAAPGLHTGFGLGRNGDSVFLYDANTNRVDALTFGLQLPDYSISRIDETWQLALPTPGAANRAASVAAQSELRINEWLADPLPGEDDWLELFNRSATAPVALNGAYLSANGTLFRVQSLSFVGPRGYTRLFADERPGPDHLEFKLPAAGGVVTLSDSTGVEVHRVNYGPQMAGVSEGFFPDGSESLAFFPKSPSPGASNYVLSYAGPRLNEILARNERANVSPWGAHSDWVELHNPIGAAVDLTGMALTDALNGTKRWTFPPGTTIAANAYLLIWCDGARPSATNRVAELNTGFGLDAENGDVVLLNAAGQPVDSVQYGFQVADLSLGRDESGWRLLSSPTPGAPNAAPAPLGAVSALRINEWLANPAEDDDWFELYNTGSLPVELSGLYLADNPSSAGTTHTQIAPLSFIGAHQWVRWVADGRLSAGRNHVNFSLDALGETLRIYDSQRGLIDAVDFGIQMAGVSEGRFPDGAAEVVPFPRTPTPGASNRLTPDAPALSQWRVTAKGEVSFVLAGPATQSYAIDYSTDLIRWEQLAIVRPTPEGIHFADERKLDSNVRYYRARSLP